MVLCVEFKAGTDKRSKTCWDKWHSAVRLEQAGAKRCVENVTTINITANVPGVDALKAAP